MTLHTKARRVGKPAAAAAAAATTAQVFHGDYETVLGGYTAHLIAESPPYNIGSKGKRRDGQRKNGKYDPKSYGAVTGYPDNLPETVYQDSQVQHFLWVADHLERDGVFVYNHKPRRRNMKMIHPAEWFLRPEVRERLQLMEEIIWDRGSTHNMGNRLMWPTTERLYVFRRTDSKDYSIFKGDHLPKDLHKDLWHIPLNARRATSVGHNVPMPEALPNAIVQTFSRAGDMVMDPYIGSGSVGVAAVAAGRNFVGADIDKNYAVLARRNIEKAG